MKRVVTLLSCIIVIAVLFFNSIFSVNAAITEVYNYEDYELSVVVDGENDLVTIQLPLDYCFWELRTSSSIVSSGVGSVANLSFPSSGSYFVNFRPMGYFGNPNSAALSLHNIPSDTVVTCGFTIYVDIDSMSSMSILDTEFFHYFLDADGFLTSSFTDTVNSLDSVGRNQFSVSYSYPLNFDSADSYYQFGFRNWLSPSGSGNAVFSLTYVRFELSISSLYRLQQESGKTNAILTEVKNQLAEQGQTLDDILASQEQTNDKLDGIQDSIDDTNEKLDEVNDNLDDVNQNLESLPGEIGDEIQGVIDSEKDKATSSGNDFVDQIHDALPDPSTEVLAALKSLTDSTAYNGTDAVLTIPAIVLPGIEGMFPTTVIWSGTSFDFGEYMLLLPSSLLSLVQNLFTIAIVLYCVYELKGIISYCLTLRESKGG